MKNNFLILFLSFVFLSEVFASKVDTISIYSQKMKKEIPVLVITPDNYKTSKKSFPVIYLLHGYSGNYGNWTYTQNLSDKYNVILVCPDGGYNSWYIDSPLRPESQYETFVSKELISWIDNNYKTIKDKKARAITGLSMGGHGGLFLGIRHQDVYGAAGSMSGGVDLRFSTTSWDIAKTLGEYEKFPARWDSLSVINMTAKLKGGNLSIIFDCGVDDFFYDINKKLHARLVEQKIPHDYIERPGKHDWEYWANAIEYQVLFFDKFFKAIHVN